MPRFVGIDELDFDLSSSSPAMQLVVFAVVFVSCMTHAASASEVLATPIKLPLRWVDQDVYVTNFSINSIPTILEVTTTTSDVSLACSHLAWTSTYTETCQMDGCTVIISRDGVNMCAAQTLATLSLPNSELELDDFPVNIVLDTPNVTTPASADTTAAGRLGLGLRSALFGSMYPELLSNKTLSDTIHNFSLYLTNASDGNGSFVQIGGVFPDQLYGFDAQELADRELSTRFSLPLRVDKNGALSGWDLSLTGVRFGSDPLLYPRVYSSSEVAGSDAVASVSLSDSIIKMPPSVFQYFCGRYLGLDCVVRDNGTACDRRVYASLPRITLYVHDKLFILDPSDYTVDSNAQLLVLLGASSSEQHWLFGSPFLRKFPSMLSLQARCIDLLCHFNVSCDSRASGASWDPQYLPASRSEASSPTPTATVAATTTLPPRSPAVIMYMGFSFGSIGVFLAVSSAIARWRHRNDPDTNSTGTVASDKDLEELQLAEGEMSSSSESRSGRRSNFTPLDSPQNTNTPPR